MLLGLVSTGHLLCNRVQRGSVFGESILANNLNLLGQSLILSFKTSENRNTCPVIFKTEISILPGLFFVKLRNFLYRSEPYNVHKNG